MTRLMHEAYLLGFRLFITGGVAAAAAARAQSGGVVRIRLGAADVLAGGSFAVPDLLALPRLQGQGHGRSALLQARTQAQPSLVTLLILVDLRQILQEKGLYNLCTRAE